MIAIDFCVFCISLSIDGCDIIHLEEVQTMTREITAAQRKAVGKYEKENYDKVLVRMPKGKREEIKAAADLAGVSLNAFIMEAIEKRIGE